MRLLYFTRTYTRHDARWLRVLAEQGLVLGFLPLQQVLAGDFAREHPTVELLASPGLPAGADTARLDGAESQVRAECEAWRPDVILAGPLTDAGYLAARIDAGRTLLMSWAFDVLHEPAVSTGARERLRDTLRRGRHLFVDCRSLADQCEALAGRKYENVCVLPWGLTAGDKPEPRLGRRQQLGDETARVVLHTRGFEPVQQPQVVVEAFRRAYAQDDTLRLWLAGAGGSREQVEALVDAGGLRPAVRFLGQLDQSELAGCFAEADAYLACSLSDGTSLSLLQAMHAGLPCIVSDLPGNREWVESAGGWLVPAGEPAAYARAIRESADLSADARAGIAAHNRLSVCLRADLAANLPLLLRTLRTVAGSSRPVALEPLSLAV
jgi:glycosyltransferase involved in cell wall biosynthesis